MNPSERIRAALDRSHSSEIEERRHAEVESTLPLLAMSDEDRIELPEPEIDSEDDNMAAGPSAAVPRKSAFPVLYIFLAAAVSCAGVTAFLNKDRLFPSTHAVAIDMVHPFKLQVDSTANGQIGIRWDPRSTALIKATQGRMEILEQGQVARTAALTPEQMAMGHLFYRSSADHVEFRMQVVGAGGATLKESILAIAPTPPVSPTPEQPKVEVVEKPAPEPKPVRATVRAFTPPPVPTPKKIDDGPAVILDASTILPSATEIKPAVVFPEMNAPPPPEPKPTQPPRQVRIGGLIQAANLIKRVAPIYPPLAKTAHIEGTVQFTAVIGKDGRVKNVQFVKGSQMLVQAGKDAVRQWVYKPMLLDGQPTEVVTEIDVVFNLK